jgi:hypothetical protein
VLIPVKGIYVAEVSVGVGATGSVSLAGMGESFRRKRIFLTSPKKYASSWDLKIKERPK